VEPSGTFKKVSLTERAEVDDEVDDDNDGGNSCSTSATVSSAEVGIDVLIINPLTRGFWGLG